MPWVSRLFGNAQCSLVERPNFRLVLEKVTQQVNCKTVLKFFSCGFEKQNPSSLLLTPTHIFSILVEKLEIFRKTQTGHGSFFKGSLFFIGPFKSNQMHHNILSIALWQKSFFCHSCNVVAFIMFFNTLKKKIFTTFQKSEAIFAASFLFRSYLKIRRWKNPHFPISEIYFVDTRKGTLPGHDFLHMIHTSQFPWLSVLEDDLSVAEKSQLLLSAEIKQVAIFSSLEVVNCSEQSWAPGTHPRRGSRPGCMQTVSSVLYAPGTIQLRNISLCEWYMPKWHMDCHIFGALIYSVCQGKHHLQAVTSCAPWEPVCVIPVPP